MEKVKLPKKVASEIEWIRKSMCPSNQDIIVAAISKTVNANPALTKYAESNFDDLLDAIVNGYEVAQTPEDMVREYFGIANSSPTIPARQAIRRTLDLLGIKIEGVNA